MKLDKFGRVAIPYLRAWRERKMLTRKDLADNSPVTVSGITKIELGITKTVHANTAKGLAKALGISVEKLATEPEKELATCE